MIIASPAWGILFSFFPFFLKRLYIHLSAPQKKKEEVNDTIDDVNKTEFFGSGLYLVQHGGAVVSRRAEFAWFLFIYVYLAQETEM